MSGAMAPEAETIIRETERVNRVLGQSQSQIERVQRSLDSAYAAQARFSQVQNTINSALERGRISQQRANELLLVAQRNYERATQSATAFGVANDNIARRTGNLSQTIGQAGFQIQDFAVQVASGQSALTAFAQQAPQFLGVLGTGGIIAGAAIAIGAVAIRLLGAADATRVFDDALKAAGDTYERNTRIAQTWREGLQDEQNRVRDLTNAYEAMNLAGREFERRRLEETRSTLRTQGIGLERQTDRELQDLRRVIDRQIAEARDATFRARRFDANAPAVQVDAGIRQGVEALTALGAPGERTADQIAEVARRLAEAAQNAGPFAELLRDTAGALDKLIPNWRTLSEAVARNERDLSANAEAAQRAGQSVAGMGNNAAGATAQVDGLTASVARLRAQTDSIVGVENTAAIARAEQRAQALARGLGAAREFDAAEAQRQSAERYFQDQRRQDEEALRSQRYSNDQIREEIARTDEARRQSSNRRAQFEAENAARLRALEEAERNARRGAAAGLRESRQEERLDERTRRERDQLISSLDQEAAANIRLEEALRRVKNARERNLLSEEEARNLSAEATRRRDTEIRQLYDKSELDAEQTKRIAGLTTDLGSIMGDAFQSLVREGDNFSDTLQNIERRLLRLGDKYLLEPLFQQLSQLAMMQLGGGGGGGGFLGGILSSLGGGGGAYASEAVGSGLAKGAEAIIGAVLHTGGVAGADGGRRAVPASAFLDAPRYHSGGFAGRMPFANDEVPAVLRRGELVMTQRQQDAVRREMGRSINQTVIVQTEDPGSFNRTKSQMARDMRRELARASRSA